MAAAVVLTVATGIDYVYRALALRRTSARAMREAAERRATRAIPEPAPEPDPAPRPGTTAA
jgi:CDP-diacylglycerol--glycerol-3-phosphate 3-phosphatidyltransferase